MRALRKRAGLSQIEVARRMGLTDSGAIGIGRNERAVQVPRADRLHAFLQTVGATFLDLQHHLDSTDPESQVSKRADELARELGEISPRES